MPPGSYRCPLILPGFPLCRLQVLRWGQLSGGLTPFGVGPGVHTKVWMGRFRRSVSLAKWDGRSSQPEEAFNILW